MAVAFDAVGSATGFSTATPSTTPYLTWTHTAGTGGSVVIAGLAWSSTTAYPPTISAITYGGNTMSPLGNVGSNGGSTSGGVLLYGITGQASGANTVIVQTSANPSDLLIGNSISFTGAGSFGTAVPNHGASGTFTVTVTGTTSGNQCVAVACHGTIGTVTWTSGTGRFDDEASNASGAGCLTGGTIAAGGSVALTATISSDDWGIVGVEVQAAATGTPGPLLAPRMPAPPVVIASNAGWRTSGHSR